MFGTQCVRVNVRSALLIVICFFLNGVKFSSTGNFGQSTTKSTEMFLHIFAQWFSKYWSCELSDLYVTKYFSDQSWISIRGPDQIRKSKKQHELELRCSDILESSKWRGRCAHAWFCADYIDNYSFFSTTKNRTESNGSILVFSNKQQCAM